MGVVPTQNEEHTWLIKVVKLKMKSNKKSIQVRVVVVLVSASKWSAHPLFPRWLRLWWSLDRKSWWVWKMVWEETGRSGGVLWTQGRHEWSSSLHYYHSWLIIIAEGQSNVVITQTSFHFFPLENHISFKEVMNKTYRPKSITLNISRQVSCKLGT